MTGVRAPGRKRRPARAPGAASHQESDWNQIDWKRAESEVKRLQQRIAKATKEGRWAKVKALQRLLTRSFYGKAIAVRRVTTNRGNRTPGVDGVIWKTPNHKYQAMHELRVRGYRPQPLRRVYIDKRDKKAKRPLGIPTMADRAMQALYLLALDPIAETTGDRSSYGFRPRRSVHDAIQRCFSLLSKRNSPTWILEADIRGCFDNLSHTMLEERIPIDRNVLHKWLKAGYLQEAVFHRTEAGTPQGGIISPVLANVALDGLEEHLREKFPRVRSHQRVLMVRYADDFIITGHSKEFLEDEVKPVVASFLAERGLELSEKKTVTTHIDDGFDFLGFHLRKHGGKLIITPPKDRVLAFLRGIRDITRANKAKGTGNLIRLLNPRIRGFCMYYRHVVSSRVFSYIDSRLWWMLWGWAKRRHSNKSLDWIGRKYLTPRHGRNHVFSGIVVNSAGKPIRLHLFEARSLQIKRHTPIQSAANPYDHTYDDYFHRRDAARRQRRLYDLGRQQRGSPLHEELHGSTHPMAPTSRVRTASSTRADREA